MKETRDAKFYSETYGVSHEIAEQAAYIWEHLDTEDGYRAYYELEKNFVDNNAPNNDFRVELACSFAWDERLENAFNRLAKEDGRFDLVSFEA